MSGTFDVQADFATVADGLETVTPVRRDGRSTTIASALRRAVTTREAAISDGKYTEADVRWHLAASELDAPPQVGEQIVDGEGESWTILQTRLATCGSRFECVTRNLAIAAGLDTLITVRRERITKGPSGAAERSWEDYRSGVRAKIQEQSAARSEQHGRQSGVVAAKIYVAEQIEVDNGYQIVARDGTSYEVIGFESPDEIGRLLVINAERRL
ncbi:MAG TPA: head-tail adaptor protein [Pirellulales bacterium]|nr:head-tail adaptor protein [Pirellulales bacterium]